MHTLKYFSIPLLLVSSLVLSSTLQAEINTSGCGADFNSALNHFGGRFNAPLVANNNAFTALKVDGSLVTWGLEINDATSAPVENGFKQITSNSSSFAGIKSDGSILSWGDSHTGGVGAPTGTGFTSIVSSYKAFAALKADGGIAVWGDANSGGSDAPFDNGYVSIVSGGSSFAALKADGSITAWGTQPNAPSDKGYVFIASNANAFAAIKADGSISSWGKDSSGGIYAPTRSGFVSIVSSYNGFASLNVDGSIYSWGIVEGKSSPTGNNFKSIIANNSAYAALTEDGSIVTWGHGSYGGEGGPSDSGYKSIVASTRSFVAIKEDGSLYAWGGANHESDNLPIDSGFTNVVASDHAFAALKTDGSIVSWGGSGSENAPTDIGYTAIISNKNAFAALKADGSIVSWGDTLAGGTGAPTDTGYVSVNGVNASTKTDCSLSLDLVAPVITLNGDSVINLSIGDTYTEPGATALDGRDGTVNVEISGTVDTATEGQYTITYTAKDSANNTATTTRTINVLPVDAIAPVISLNGSATISINRNDTYQELGATANDARDGEISVTISGNVDVSALGDYTITYTAKDVAGNEATLTRTVSVVDGTKPVITLNGEAAISVSQGETYTDAGATAVDDVDGTVEVITTGSVDTQKVGEYTLTYHASDAAGNEATQTRIITVVDATKPVISLNGKQTVTLNIGQSYVEAGANATDDQDGELNVSVSGAVNTNKAGTYTLTYKAIDAAGNEAVASRTIIVKDSAKPVIHLNGRSTIHLTVGDNYNEFGATATDNVDGTVSVSMSGTVDTNKVGQYTIYYVATDAAGNTTTKTRLVIVDLPDDTVKPVLTLNGEQILRLSIGDTYIEKGAKAIDERDGELDVTIRGTVNTHKAGVNTLYYEATDKAGNTAQIIRKVIVSAPAQRPSGGGSFGWLGLLMVGLLSLRKRFIKT